MTRNPLLNLSLEPALESLGNDYYDPVTAATFPDYLLRFRNDQVLRHLGVDPSQVTDDDVIEAFGKFQGAQPRLALRYHGYQFGEYNPHLGDGRGFLYGQVRGADGDLYDFGTKGSGTTPYSRQADGRLTLKGGVREVIAAEMLHRFQVKTSRCLSLIETGEALWRGDEPSPTRSCVMVRVSRSHIRFGTFERLHYLGRPDLIQRLLDHVIATYYPHLQAEADRYSRFYAELVLRVAELTAHWMASGFCHAVLNTDNMSITGESFDYGPYAFIETYNPDFVAAYFDYFGRYRYAHQPKACQWNLMALQRPLAMVIDPTELESGLSLFDRYYQAAYQQRLLHRLGLADVADSDATPLISATIALLQTGTIGYHQFFATVRDQFCQYWQFDPNQILEAADRLGQEWQGTPNDLINTWLQYYHYALKTLPKGNIEEIRLRLHRYNPQLVTVRSVIESCWEPIAQENDWQAFYTLLETISSDVDGKIAAIQKIAT